MKKPPTQKERQTLQQVLTPEVTFDVPLGFHCTEDLCKILNLSKSSVNRKIAKLRKDNHVEILMSYKNRSNGRKTIVPYYKLN